MKITTLTLRLALSLLVVVGSSSSWADESATVASSQATTTPDVAASPDSLVVGFNYPHADAATATTAEMETITATTAPPEVAAVVTVVKDID